MEFPPINRYSLGLSVALKMTVPGVMNLAGIEDIPAVLDLFEVGNECKCTDEAWQIFAALLNKFNDEIELVLSQGEISEEPCHPQNCEHCINYYLDEYGNNCEILEAAEGESPAEFYCKQFHFTSWS